MAIKRKKDIKVLVKLPSSPSKPSVNLSDYIVLLYGIKKIGKTSMCQYFDNPFFIMLEPGAKALPVYQTCDENGKPRIVKSWVEFKEWIKLLEKDKKYKVIIIDTVDRLFKLCQKDVCKRLCITHPSEGEWGKGWEAVREEFEEWVLGRLLGMGKGVVFISHAKEAEIKTRVGDTYNKITATMANQAKEAIEGVIDVWCHYCYDGENRYLTIRGDDHTDAGHRLRRHFKYIDGTRIRKIPMGKSEKEAYDNFIAAFYNELEAPKKKVVKHKKLNIKRRK